MRGLTQFLPTGIARFSLAAMLFVLLVLIGHSSVALAFTRASTPLIDRLAGLGVSLFCLWAGAYLLALGTAPCRLASPRSVTLSTMEHELSFEAVLSTLLVSAIPLMAVLDLLRKSRLAEPLGAIPDRLFIAFAAVAVFASISLLRLVWYGAMRSGAERHGPTWRAPAIQAEARR